jgi:hypothetical protein
VLLEDKDSDEIDWKMLDFDTTSDTFTMFSVDRGFQVKNSTEDKEIKVTETFIYIHKQNLINNLSFVFCNH